MRHNVTGETKDQNKKRLIPYSVFRIWNQSFSTSLIVLYSVLTGNLPSAFR
ncbi:hypothetical protein DET54_104202 [Paenibacillus pabuli]|uniref:Uncharacterized protein n=1 Tax=Paenibacillus pabuli TaxID=1472 RepID=A0A855XRL3_9BACL|nr:hypothetical protein DET56_111196 [Paenibacillus pabuli]PXW03242.1 hypothetical protein DEU73_110196 [Paenibacillus taichungensis]RAI98146.1 hypothetical protein DET54_104202 [Paenibacillus pabuli]